MTQQSTSMPVHLLNVKLPLQFSHGEICYHTQSEQEPKTSVHAEGISCCWFACMQTMLMHTMLQTTAFRVNVIDKPLQTMGFEVVCL